MAPPVRDGADPIPATKKEEEKPDVERRFERLEARLAALQQRFADAMGQEYGANGAETAISDEPTPKDTSPARPDEKNPPQDIVTIFDGVKIKLGPSGDGGSTVVRGPWVTSTDVHDEPEPIGSEDPTAGDAYHAHEQRVAALEDTFGQLERMVEGLASKPRGKGQPPS